MNLAITSVRTMERYRRKGYDRTDQDMTPPGRPPAVFDPERRRLWEACKRAEAEQRAKVRREAKRASNNRSEAHRQRMATEREKLRVSAVEADGGREDYPGVNAAAKAIGVFPGAVYFALRHGTLCGGRRWERPGKPVAKTPGRKRTTDRPWADADRSAAA